MPIGLKPSRIVAILLALAHGASIVVVWMLSIVLWAKLASLPIIAASAWFYIRRDALLRSPVSAVSLLLREDGSIEVTQRRGATFSAVPLPGSFVTPQLTLVKYRIDSETRARYAMIVPDMIDAEDFRRLRIHLKWRTPGAARNDQDAML